jgi:protein gp37
VHCYAETFAERFRDVPGHPYEYGFDLRLVPDKLSEPLRWADRRTVFVNSMSDLFHASVPESYIRAVVAVMKATPWHTYQVLTKRADRLQRLLSGPLRSDATLSNVWWGVSVENKRHGLPRIAYLRAAPAWVRFLSVEPLLEHIGMLPLNGIHWVIVGGESGHGARKMDEGWVTSILDQCRSANIPFFFKQWGGVQKKRHGRVLRGQTYNEMPARSRVPVAHVDERRSLRERFDAIAQAFTAEPIPLQPIRKTQILEEAVL